MMIHGNVILDCKYLSSLKVPIFWCGWRATAVLYCADWLFSLCCPLRAAAV